MSGFIDASGAEVVTGAAGAGAASASGAGTSSSGAASAAAPARRLDVALRRRVQTVLLYEKGASNVPAAFDPSPPLIVTDYAEALFYAVILGGAGAPAGVAVSVQSGDAVNGLWIAHPQGALTVAGAAGPNAIFALGALTTLGDLVRMGVSAATPWTGGTVQLWAKLKG